MTVIAFDGRIAAADTCMSTSASKWRGARSKIVPLKKGGKVYCLGYSGDSSLQIPAWEFWLSGGKRPWPLNGPSGVMTIFTLDRVVEYRNGVDGYPLECPIPYAAGSGDAHAETAMHLGHSAIEAVEVACKLATGCEMPLTAFDLVSKEWIHRHDTPNDQNTLALLRKYKVTPL